MIPTFSLTYHLEEVVSERRLEHAAKIEYLGAKDASGLVGVSSIEYGFQSRDLVIRDCKIIGEKKISRVPPTLGRP